MKKAILSLLAVLALGLTGCVSASDGTIRIKWAITVNGQPGTCAQVGATHITVFLTETGRTLSPVEFNCTATGTGDIQIASGVYGVEIQITDAQGTRLNSVPITTTVDLSSGEIADLGTFEFSFNLNFSATFRVQWGTTNESCSSGGIALEEVRIASGNQCLQFPLVVGASTQGTCTPYVCQAGNVDRTIQNLPPGSYLIQVIGWKGATSATPHACYYSDAVACSSTACNLSTLVARFNPLPADEQFCNATKPESDIT